jgi:hypothetical protein
MNRWLGVCSVAFLLVASTGCLHHGVRGGCNSCGPAGHASCQSGSCGQCSTGSCGGSCGEVSSCGSCRGGGRVGILNRVRNRVAGCGGACGGACGAVPMGWQQGGLNYGSHLGSGLLGHGGTGLMGHGAGAQLDSQPFNPGPPTAQVAYPYYTHRGPRDFLVDNPPTIGR